jgi:hypothetical protein
MSFDIESIRARLETVASDAMPGSGPWLAASWCESAGFWSALASHNASLFSPAAKSHPSSGFDFYHDMVLRHRPDSLALRIHEPGRGWRTLSYGQLDTRSSLLADDWTARGLVSGTAVCILLPLGVDFAVSLVTALRLGLLVSVLPPLGPRWVQTRLAQLQQAKVITTPHYVPLAPRADLVLLAEATQARSGVRRSSHSYPANAPVGALFSEHVDPPEAPQPILAAALYLGALRDSLLLLGLRPGAHVAAPGASFLQHQPALLLSTFLAGATFVHVDLEELRLDPSLITSQPLQSLGISVALRDLLLAAEVAPVRGWAHWFRNPEEAVDAERWRAFIRRLDLENVPTSNLLFDASTGGSVLFSLRRRGRLHQRVLPAPGRPWSLAATSGAAFDEPAPDALGDVGLFAPREPTREPYFILIRSGNEYLYGGPVGGRFEGRVYPRQEIVKLALSAPGVTHAIVFLDRAANIGRPLRVLIGFTGAKRSSLDDVESLRATIGQALGPELVPDHIELVPAYPRLENGTLDERWCEAQLQSRMFHHKSKRPAFQLLTLLRHATGMGMEGIR